MTTPRHGSAAWLPRGARSTRVAGNGARASSTLLLSVDIAEHQLQVLSDARSPAALQVLGYASAAQRAAGVSRLVLACAFSASDNSRKTATRGRAQGSLIEAEWAEIRSFIMPCTSAPADASSPEWNSNAPL